METGVNGRVPATSNVGTAGIVALWKLGPSVVQFPVFSRKIKYLVF